MAFICLNLLVFGQQFSIFEGTVALVTDELAVLVRHRQLGWFQLYLGHARVKLLPVRQSLFPVFKGHVADDALVNGAMHRVEMLPQHRAAFEHNPTLVALPVIGTRRRQRRLRTGIESFGLDGCRRCRVGVLANQVCARENGRLLGLDSHAVKVDRLTPFLDQTERVQVSI